MEVVINRCYGGFNLSQEAVKWLKDKGSPIVEKRNAIEFFGESICADVDNKCKLYGMHRDSDDVYYLCRGTERNHPDLVAVVKALGDKANGMVSELAMVKIPDDIEWEIDEYDGWESVVEKHRSWS